ncbi:hypothetical protein IMSAGC013_04266 [Lachnospiraceae bacterium]|nr:hypothetical protein IMSAGC013_04266 [Lachnospiraceae bacterium]
MLQIHAKDGRFRHSQITGDAGRHIYFLGLCVFPLQYRHGKNGGTLGYIRKGNHRPQHRSLIICNQLQVYGIGHMVKPCNHQRRIYKSENCAENHFKRTCNPCINHRRNGRTYLPSNRPQNKMRSDNRQQQTAERHHNHGNHLGRYFPEKFLQIYKGKSCQNRRNHLSLISNHINLKESEIPDRNFFCPGHRISIEQLPGNQRQTQDNPKHLGGSHFLCNRPADSHRKHMEHRFSNQPQEAVNSRPELADIA